MIGNLYDHPIPWRWHRCKAVMLGRVNGDIIRRCACGAIQINSTGWTDRNSRRS